MSERIEHSEENSLVTFASSFNNFPHIFNCYRYPDGRETEFEKKVKTILIKEGFDVAYLERELKLLAEVKESNRKDLPEEYQDIWRGFWGDFWKKAAERNLTIMIKLKEAFDILMQHIPDQKIELRR